MPPKKKLSKKEKARLEAEQAEMLRIEMEKEKLRKLEEARERRKVEQEQAKRRLQVEIQENKLRRFQLKNSMGFFKQVRESIGAIKMAERNQNDWEKFMRCNGLPNSNSPSDLRKYIHQWQVDIERRNRESRNWLLKINERTLLTQNTSVADFTKTALRKKQGNLGDVYAQRIREILGILLELEDVLAYGQKADHTLIDLNKLKTEIRVLLKDYLDDFTHKILSHIERDMEVDRPGVSMHIYDSDVFKSFIWTFSKDAQISLCAKPRIGEQNLHNGIDFPSIDMKISLPPTVSLFSSALRALWLSYDHLSDYCPSFKLKRPRLKHPNILRQTKKEWRKRKEILQSMLDDYSKEIPLTELEQYEHENGLNSEHAHKKSYDVEKLYLEYEDELNKLRRKAIGPDGFHLLDSDVNLRKYRIIGGVYCVDYLETPQQYKQLDERSFIRTIIASNKLLHKKYYQTFKPAPPPQAGVKRLPEEIEAEIRKVEAALEKLVLITVQLPDSVIWFEPPIACRWETDYETLESDATGDKQFDDAYNGRAADNTNSFPPFNVCSNQLVKEINDFDLLRMPKNIDIQALLKDFVAPRLPVGFSALVDGSPLEQLHQTTQQTVGKNNNKIRKLLFLAKPKTLSPSFPSERPPTNQSIDLQKLAKVRLSENHLDFDEPKEFFQHTPLDKVLKIKALNSHHEIKLNEDSFSVKLEKSPSITRDVSKESSGSVENSKDSPTRRSSKEYEQKEGNKTYYMFSQLIEDLDRLRNLQTQVLQEELLQQISVNLMGKKNGTMSLNGKDIRCDAADAEIFTEGAHGEETAASVPTTLTDITQPFAFPSGRGISFVRETETNKEEESMAEDISSTDETEIDGDDYEDSFINCELEKKHALTPACSQLSSRYYDDKSLELKPEETIFTHGKWSTRDIHDTKFNEEKLSIQFRTGRLGIFGFALSRYSNMPYQTWEIKPDTECPDHILFSFTASLVSLDITITTQGFCVTNFQGGSTVAINGMIGKTLPLDAIKAILISSAVDIFPDEDAFCYTEGSCEKNYMMEMHLYDCMSTLSLSHNFSWSRWNLLAGSRTIVLLFKEFQHGKKVPNHSTLLVTPLKATIIDCTEVSASFNSQSIAGMKYYADLYQLGLAHAQPSSLEKQRNMNPLLRDNVAAILMAIRPLSFC